MSVRKFKSYSTMNERLKDLGIEKSGSHATFLFNVFIFGKSRIFADNVTQAGLLRQGEIFKEWRNRLIRLNIINSDYDGSKNNKHRSNYSPGYKIVDLINKEIALRSIIATEQYVESKLSDFIKKDDLLEVIKCAIQELKPPIDDDKIKRVMEAVRLKREETCKQVPIIEIEHFDLDY